jgi:anthranilate synthase/indole-3-glycerol phosphate synthase/phosphoribosylanthranilate isomerase
MSSSTTPPLPEALQGQLDVLMIDNFDSFTWNLYQQLCLLGANVTVIRNDAIVPEHFPLLKLNYLLISPGPGHPQTDSGVSKQAIKFFTGKVPVLGVCMGLECLIDLHGGEIGYAGEIMHGKTSRVRHDNRGCFKNVPQGITSIRYHSLSTQLASLPADIAITSTTEESGVIMGVRHRKYTVEAVQYHPESILSANGDDLIRNFLKLRGGTWEENPDSGVLDTTLPPFPIDALPPSIKDSDASAKRVPTILERIYAQRANDVEAAQAAPGTSLADLTKLHSLGISPPQISFANRLKQDISPDSTALLAEIKRASPSKGPIAINANPAEQALKYALAGASTISVLTEPHFFLGSLQDMSHVRQAVANLPNRPAILRKDFILSKYQVLESRIWGADTILLIVAMLPDHTLKELFTYSRELGMEPLVEVNNEREMEVALALGAKVIGVNNRNLHDFKVDMQTASRVGAVVQGKKDVTLLALSGITSHADVVKYRSEGVHGVLVGESLMRAADTTAFVKELLGNTNAEASSSQWTQSKPLVKVCGVRTAEEAIASAEAGVDLIGLNFVPESKRYINISAAKEISAAIHKSTSSTQSSDISSLPNAPWFTGHANRFSQLRKSRPLLVALFQNASLATILSTLSQVEVDLVQLHGDEPLELSKHIPVPVIRASGGVPSTSVVSPGLHQFILVDSSAAGGTGQVGDWQAIKEVVARGENDSRYPLPIILAGGLTPENVAEAISVVRPWAVDVAGGVEGDSGKDIAKIQAFVKAVKG